MNEKNQSHKINPPEWARKFLHWYCDPELVEEIDGDLLETFREIVKTKGERRAKWNYILNTVLFLRPFAVKNKKKQFTPNHLAMLKNYIVVAYRSLIKKVGYSLINIFGLSVGITSCLLIMMYVQYETSYDNFHDNIENKYRIALDRHYPDREMKYAYVPHSYPPQLVEDYPEVLSQTMVVQFPGNFSVTFQYGDQLFDEPNIIFGDSNYFDFVKAEFIDGDPDNALNGPNQMVLSESTARKYFGDSDPIGKSLTTAFFGPNGNDSWLITGVIKDFPKNSHIEFDLIGTHNGFQFMQAPNWMAFSVLAYIELTDGTNMEVVNEKFPDMVKKYAAGQIQQQTGQSYEEYTAAGHGYTYYLQPMKDIHLSSNLEGEFKTNSSWNYIYILISVASFILLIACINFMNLSTARSAERAKEVGLRKVLGSLRKLLVFQFLTESMLLSTFSTILSFVLVFIALPYFNGLTGVPLSIQILFEPLNIVIIILGALIIGALAGSYPAFVLSSFQPVAVLKSKIQSSKSGKIFRDGLVVFQFSISIILIAATIIIFDQMEFILNKSLGFNDENVIAISNTGQLNERGEVFRQELINIEEITNASYVGPLPGDTHIGFVAQLPGASETQVILSTTVDENYFEAMEIPLLSGRDFSKQFNDSLTLIVNETAANVMGFADPIGKRVGTPHPNPQNAGEIIYFTIVGMVADYHFQSLHNNIGPLVFAHATSVLGVGGPGALNKLALRFKSNNPGAVIAKIEEKWAEFMPGSPFSYYYLEDELGGLYSAERTTSHIFTIFTTLAIIIACVGLFGLAAYTAGLKTKEIGVRKVLGASVGSIVLLLSKEFAKLIFIAIAIAVPVAYFGMDKWLEDFAYRINIDPLSFVLAGLLAILIGWLTVSFQSFKAAIVNPVKSLRSE
ncbi:MAG: permease prefix domain 2-containing transporter [Cyclobacteriaceae bacterium]